MYRSPMGSGTYYGKTRQEVSQKLLQAQRALSDGLPLAGERQSTGAFLESWLFDSAGQKVRPKTLRRYQELVRLHVVPEIGRVPLARLTPQHVEKIISAVAAKGASPRSTAHCRAVCRFTKCFEPRHASWSDSAKHGWPCRCAGYP